MIELSRRFVPCADEVWRLQRDDDPECLFFRRAVHGRTDPSGGSMQGIYVFAASGVLLGRLNSLHADEVAKMLEAALAKWEDLPAESRALDQDLAVGHRWEDSYPEGGLVLQRIARDIGAEFDPTAERRQPSNSDQVWFRADEARDWLPGEPVAGAEHAVPELLAQRLARFHLVDNVRGQTLPFAPEEVRARLRSRVESVDGSLVTLRIDGEVEGRAGGPWLLGENYWKPAREWPRSITTALFGRARFDLASGSFAAFDLVALGTRVGRTGYNGRSREDNTTPRGIGFLFRIAPEHLRVAPTFINVYNATWVSRPGE